MLTEEKQGTPLSDETTSLNSVDVKEATWKTVGNSSTKISVSHEEKKMSLTDFSPRSLLYRSR